MRSFPKCCRRVHKFTHPVAATRFEGVRESGKGLNTQGRQGRGVRRGRGDWKSGSREIKSQRKEATPKSASQKQTPLAPLSDDEDCKAKDGSNQRHHPAGGTLNIMHLRLWRVPKIKGFA